MAETNTILRKSIHLFLQNYSYITSVPALLLFPSSLAILLSSSFAPPIHARLESLFAAAGFPSNSQFFSLLTLKLSQTISSSISSLPFSLTFLLIAKAFVIQKFASPSSPFLSLYQSLLQTHVFNSLFLISANAAAFSLLFLSFNSIDALGLASPAWALFLSATGAILYSMIIAIASVICQLAIIIAGMENSGGFPEILKACTLILDRTRDGLTLALPTNLGLAAVEALFQFRVVRSYRSGESGFSVAWEGPLLIYIYSLLVLLDTIIGCVFYKSCKSGRRPNQAGKCLLIEILEEHFDDMGLEKMASWP